MVSRFRIVGPVFGVGQPIALDAFGRQTPLLGRFSVVPFPVRHHRAGWTERDPAHLLQRLPKARQPGNLIGIDRREKFHLPVIGLLIQPDEQPEKREKLGINKVLLRLSVGIEDVSDLIDDLDRAFALEEAA